MVANAVMEKVYRSFYTKSDPIVSYMIEKLSLKENLSILEPCAGHGVFVDALINKDRNIHVDTLELNPDAVKIIKEKYGKYNNIKIRQADTLLDPELLWYSNAGGLYDRIIANPPYGGWLDHQKRKTLKKLYPDLYAKETYALFLYRCIQLLKKDGILVFIVPDTFLNLHMHTKLREFILTNTKIKELALFPSCFFPGVNFGYSNLSIITLQKTSKKEHCLENTTKILTGFKKVEQLGDLALKKPTDVHIHNVLQKKIFENIDHGLFLNGDKKIIDLINNSKMRIADIADCVTGFYSGDDKRYLRVASADMKNGSKYKTIEKKLICDDFLKQPELRNGLNGDRYFIPIVKGGGIMFYKPDLWYMDWSKKAVKEYRESKKSRFQNSDFYFKYGIGVPMISSSQITAAILENRLFDQSIVGIFPKDEKLVYFMLAFFNSSTCNKLIRTINPSANNPANYIKKIPFVIPSYKKEISLVNNIVRNIIDDLKNGHDLDQERYSYLNRIFYELYGF